MFFASGRSSVHRRIALLVLCLFTFGWLVGPGFAEEKNEEFIIEGEYKRPSKSSFEYGEKGSEDADTEAIGRTEDLPRTGDPDVPEPSLEKHFQRQREDVQSQEGTRVNEFGTREILSIILGIGVFMATNG